MTGQIAGPSAFSLELVALIVGISMVVGAADVIRLPGWAWRRAEESKAAYLILVILLPVIGLALYVFKSRPKVSATATAGRAASLPFEQPGKEAADKQSHEIRPAGEVAAPIGFGSFGADHGPHLDPTRPAFLFEPDEDGPGEDGLTADDRYEISGTFFSSGGTTTKSLRLPRGRTRPYRPIQRTSLPGSSVTLASLTATTEAVPTVPAGWKADPTGRHQFRYWDGFHWTENVADAGQQSRDSVVS
jgi:hypothetical protein